jgi:hypothetical protein
VHAARHLDGDELLADLGDLAEHAAARDDLVAGGEALDHLAMLLLLLLLRHEQEDVHHHDHRQHDPEEVRAGGAGAGALRRRVADEEAQ